MPASQQFFIDANGQAWALSVNPDGSLTTTEVTNVSDGLGSGLFTIGANSIIDSVIQDAQNGTTNRTALLDYLDRVCQRILRDTQWIFLRSQPQKFITQPGSSDYFIASGNAPAGTVNTGLALSDVWSVWTESVFNRTSGVQLTPDSDSAKNRQGLSFKDGSSRPGVPRSFKYEFNNPGILSIFPASDVNNSYQPVPRAPLCSFNSGGSLAGRTYYVCATYVDAAGNEGTESINPTAIYIPAGSLLTAASPAAEVASALQIAYSQWNCYVGTSLTSMTKQNASPVAIGASFTEPSSGLIAGTSVPQNSTLTPLNGYVIEFRYYQQRQPIISTSQYLQIPINYRDVVIAGVNYYASLYTNKNNDMERAGIWKQEFLDGIRQIRKDFNLNFRNTDFIGPDVQTQYRANDAYGIALFG